ncbi:hypothetical protein MKEN_01159800 [Mycena kentingensis (nom. inval.)]|nr:hypothetical protein MKEN_01159800 [Mycena kentingensis (nom. inval.)]
MPPAPSTLNSNLESSPSGRPAHSKDNSRSSTSFSSPLARSDNDFNAPIYASTGSPSRVLDTPPLELDEQRDSTEANDTPRTPPRRPLSKRSRKPRNNGIRRPDSSTSLDACSRVADHALATWADSPLFGRNLDDEDEDEEDWEYAPSSSSPQQPRFDAKPAPDSPSTSASGEDVPEPDIDPEHDCEYRTRLTSVSQSLFDARKTIEQTNVLIALSHVPHGIQETARLRQEMSKLASENIGLRAEVARLKAHAHSRELDRLREENARMRREREVLAGQFTAAANEMAMGAMYERVRLVAALGGVFDAFGEAHALSDTRTTTEALARLASPVSAGGGLHPVEDDDLVALVGIAQESRSSNWGFREEAF